MSEIVISGEDEYSRGVRYIYNSTSRLMCDAAASVDIKCDNGRATMSVNADGIYFERLKSKLVGCVAETAVLIGKHKLFKSQIEETCLPKNEYSFLLAALVSVNYRYDAEYVARSIECGEALSIDGIANFRLKEAKERWTELCSVIPRRPDAITAEKLIRCIISDNKNGKVFFKDGQVYDSSHNKLRRASLLNERDVSLSGLNEIILSEAKNVECIDKASRLELKFFDKYYKGRVSFDI